MIIEPLGTTPVPATTELFVVRENFKVDTSPEAKVKISFIGDNFQRWFTGKCEAPCGERSLRYGRLKQRSVDAPIIAELGGEAAVETSLADVWALMAGQPNGEAGKLLNNGWANVFYVKDLDGVVRAVGVFWRGGGWDVGAYEVGSPGPWHGGSRVFSRNS